FNVSDDTDARRADNIDIERDSLPARLKKRSTGDDTSGRGRPRSLRIERGRRSDSMRRYVESQSITHQGSIDNTRMNDPRSSYEELDSTAPNSPQVKGISNISDGFVPSLTINLSPANTRHSSPERDTIEKLKSKIGLVTSMSDD